MAGTDVKAMLLQIDASVELLKKNLKAGSDSVDEFEKKARANLTRTELAFDKLGAVAEGTAKRFETLRAGLDAIGLVLPALVLGEMAKKGLEFAAAIGEQAKQAGVSAEKLQELRYAATQTGVSQDALQTTLIRLNQNLGKAELGSTKMQKAFEAVGVSQVELKNHTATVDEAFAKLSDKMHSLGPSAQAAGLASTVIGRSWAEAAPMLYAGSERINELSDAAQRLGIVLSDQQIQNSEQTAHKLKELELVLEARIAGIVADNAGAIYHLATSLANLAAGLAKIDSQKLLTILGALGGATIGKSFGGGWGAAAGLVLGGAYGYGAGRPAQDYADAANEQIHEMRRLAHSYGWKGDGSAGDQQALAAVRKDPRYQQNYRNALISIQRMHNAEGSGAIAAAPDLGGGGGGDLPNILGGGGRHQHDDTAERLRDAENKTYEAAKQELSQKQQLLQAQEKMTLDTEDRLSIGIQLINNERDQKALEIEHNLKIAELDPKLTDAKKAELEAAAKKQLALNEQLEIYREQELLLQHRLDQEKEFEQHSLQELEAKTTYLQLQGALAQTAAERRRVELEILELTYQEKKRALEAIQNDTFSYQDPASGQWVTEPVHSPAEIESARMQEVQLTRNHPLEVQQTILSTAGPMDQFLRSIPDTAQKAAEALQNVEVQGLQSISQGIVDVITGTKSLGAAFHDIANQIISDLLKIALQKEIIGPLANALFGAGGGLGGLFGAGGGGNLDALIGAIPAFAGGGDPAVGMPSLVGERGPELFIPKVPGTIVPNHALGGGPQVIYVAVDKSALFDVHVQSQAAQVVAAAAPGIVAGAHGATMKALTRQGING